MNMVKIVGKEYYCKDIFSDSFSFKIPRFQRPYAWTTEETEALLDDLWTAYTADDLLVKDKSLYFLGSIVLIKEEHQPHAEVIDGQQRLTTLTILLSVLRHLLQNGDSENASGITAYLQQKGKPLEDLKDESRLMLRDQDANFFEKYIQKDNGLSEIQKLHAPTLPNDAQRNILDNSLYFLGNLKNKSNDQLADFSKFIITKCIMVVVSTPDMESAYRIFSVMNDRGLDLSHADILKSEIIGSIESDDLQDMYGRRWETVEDNLGREAFDDLFAHIRMIHVKQKMRSTIIKEIREYVKPNSKPMEFIDKKLEPFANALKMIKCVNYQSPQGAETVNIHLRWLNRVNNIDWIPPAIVALAQHANNSEWLGVFFQRLERLAVGLMVMKSGINERLERYGKLLSALQDEKDILAQGSILGLTDEEKSKILKNLDGSLYEMTKVRLYVLLRLDCKLSGGGAEYNYPNITIEHVLPQTPEGGSKWLEWFPEEKKRSEWVHRIGNLVLLTRPKNSEAWRHEFDIKKEKYFKSDKGISPFVLTTQVLGEKEWTPTVLEKRQKDLMSKLKEIWEL